MSEINSHGRMDKLQVKFQKFFQHLKLHRADIVFPQETHLKINYHMRHRRPWVGQVFIHYLIQKPEGLPFEFLKMIIPFTCYISLCVCS